MESIGTKRELSTDTPEPTKHYSTRSTTQSAKNAKNNIPPRLKPLPYTELDLYNQLKAPSRHLESSIEVMNETIELYQTEDHPFNRRGFKYKPCSPNPLFPSLMYSTTDLPPYQVRFSYFDRSQGAYLDDSSLRMSSDQGWRSSRANVAVREGSHYFEYKILRANEEGDSGHVRIGIGRKEASIEAPVGFDGYGYGLRDKLGQKIHLSRPVDFMKGGFKTGDVVGILLTLPSLEEQRKIAQLQKQKKIKSDPLIAGADLSSVHDIDTDVVRDQIPIRYKNQLFFEQYEYTSTTPIEHLLNPVTVFGEKAIPDKDKFKPAILPNSSITVYKNGELVGVAFQDLLAFLPPSSEQSQNPVIANLKKSKRAGDEDDLAVVKDDGSLGYYPMASSYKNGCVELNAGPDFYHLPEDVKAKIAAGEVNALSSRYEDKVIEDVLFDIIDEVESEYLDALEAE